MKKKVLLFTFCVMILSVLFTVSTSAGDVYLLDFISGKHQKVTVAAGAGGTYNLYCSYDENNGLSVYVDGKKVTLDLLADIEGLEPCGLNSGRLMMEKVTVDSAFYTPTSYTMPENKMAFYAIGYELTGKYAGLSFKKAALNDTFLPGEKVVICANTSYPTFIEFTNVSLMRGDDWSLQATSQGADISVEGSSDLALSIRNHLNNGRVDGFVYEFASEESIENISAFNCVWRLTTIPNNYDIYASVYDPTKKEWVSSRVSDALVVSSAKSFKIVDRDGVGAFEIVRSSGTSYIDCGPLEGLMFTPDPRNVTPDGYIQSGFKAADLPYDLLAREVYVSDGALTLYVGEPVPVGWFLTDVERVNFSINDFVASFSNVIVTIPLVSLFAVLLPLVSFGIGLLIRSKHS